MAQRISLIFLSIFIFYSKIGLSEDYRRTVITDPSISRKCQLLTETRKEKILNKQRILAMIERNKHLQKISPENKVSIKQKLEINLGHLEHELSLAQTQIQYQEENIVRKGCPGVTL